MVRAIAAEKDQGNLEERINFSRTITEFESAEILHHSQQPPGT
jgi:hypothetical protein